MGVKKGINDLQTLFPSIAAEWNYDKNGDLKPDMVTYGSGRNVWWKCEIGHGWQATINRRTNQKSGCPICSNREVLSGFNDLLTVFPEVAEEWDYEKNEIKPSEILFGSHAKVWWKCKEGHCWEAPLDRRTGKTKSQCPYCTNHYMTKGVNDLRTTKPELLEEWDYKKNGDLKPEELSKGSHQVVWWKCREGHSWSTPVYRRTGKEKSGCPYCSGHFFLKGMNDLQLLYPEIATEWNYEKNGG